MKNMLADIRAARPTYASLATALSMAIQHGDIQLAVQLAWRLILQPDCPLRIQAHAVLVHSALVLRLGARPQIIEGNLRTTIHRLGGGTELKRLVQRGRTAHWRLDALAHLHSALRSLRLHGDIPFRVRYVIVKRVRLEPFTCSEHIVEGLRKMDLGPESDDVTTTRDSAKIEE